MREKEKIKKYLEYKQVSKNQFYKATGLSVGFLDSGTSLGADKLKIIINAFPDLSLPWLLLDEGDMIGKPSVSVDNNSGVIINGANRNSPIDNRHYYSDSPDVLRAQIEMLDDRIKEKDAQIKEKDAQMKEILGEVYEALKEKGYNPISQIVGYILSEDPTYITTHNNARSLIRKIDRDELLQTLVREFLKG